MAPRKRTTLYPKSLSSKNNSKSPDKGKDTINSSDLTLYLRLSILILLVLAVGGFLLYPDILNIIKVFQENSADNVRTSEKTQESLAYTSFANTRSFKQNGDIQADALSDSIEDAPAIFDDAKDEDLMEDEESYKTIEQLKSAQGLNMKEQENTTKVKYQNSLPEKEPNGKRTETVNDKSSSSRPNANKQVKTNKSHKEKTGHKTAPIVLSAKNNKVVLDQSQIKFVDSSGESINTKRVKESAGSSKTQKTENTKQMPSRPTRAETQKTNNDGGNLDAVEESKKFNPTFQKTFTPKKIFADGRRIPPVELLHQKTSNSSVRVFLFDDFLSQQECDGLIKAHDSHVKTLDKPPILCFDSIATLRKHINDARKKINVTPKDFTKGTKCVNASFSLQLQEWMKSNWSYSTAFYPGESTFSKVAAFRIKEAMGLDPASGGKFQITSYPEGKAYKEHTDCSLGGKDLRDRVVSVLMYLSNVDEGGETTFPELGIWVKPKKGRAVVWNNMSPDGVCEEHSKHVASVVKKGSKYILIRWYYYKTFYLLGQRPKEPHLPEREPGQPMVNCDEYNSGSCRWYDEWSYQHLLDYEKSKL